MKRLVIIIIIVLSYYFIFYSIDRALRIEEGFEQAIIKKYK